jgi:hypothetical protein
MLQAPRNLTATPPHHLKHALHSTDRRHTHTQDTLCQPLPNQTSSLTVTILVPQHAYTQWTVEGVSVTPSSRVSRV